MHLQILTLERFQTIGRVLRRRGPTSARELDRIHWIKPWELEQAAALGLVRFEVRRPRTGRPSRIVVLPEEVSKSQPTELLPSKWDLPRGLSIRHDRFVWRLAQADPLVQAYYNAGYRPRSHAAAKACASRLARRPQIRAARRYIGITGRHFCQLPEDIARHGGYLWLYFLHSLPVDPDAVLRCRLAAGRNLEEARDLVGS